MGTVADRRPWDEHDDAPRNDPAGPGAGPGAAPSAACEARDDAPDGRETAGGAASGPAGAGSRLRRRASPPTSSGGGRGSASTSADARWYRLASRLTERDRLVVGAVDRFGVLTTEQLGAMFFDSTGRAQVRLLALHRMGLLDRFQPWRAGFGARPYHYVLGRVGAALLAAEDGDDPDTAVRRRRRAKGLALAGAQRLAHLVGVNGLHASLVAEARRSPSSDLEDWMTEAEAARWTTGLVRPDAWGRWREWGGAVEFFVEWDRGTEALRRLVAKLEGYERFEAERGAAAWVLFVFPSARRERTARSALTAATVPLATAVAGDGRLSAAGAVWLPLVPGPPRVRLADLSLLPVPPEAEERAREGSARRWRYVRADGDGSGSPW